MVRLCNSRDARILAIPVEAIKSFYSNCGWFESKTHPAHPPLRDAEVGDGKPDGDNDTISSPKRASWTKGFAARTGGDTQKYGGDEAAG